MLVSDKKSALYLKSYFKQIGIQDIVICPGSRNLPLIVNFSNDDYFRVYSILDERVAGFFALGIAKAKKIPVAVITTSGSAAINLAPAMAEAYYQRLPLIALTADRPASFINKGENQTILQRGLFSNYIGLELEIEEKLDFNTFEEKIQILQQFLENPTKCSNVHINLPFSEPLDKVENILGDFQFKFKTERIKTKGNTTSKITAKEGQNVIIYLSTNSQNSRVNEILNHGVDEKNWVVISEMHSGWNHEKTISQIDLILARNNRIQSPDILITIGETMLSKRFRNYIKLLGDISHYDLSSYTRNWDNLSAHYRYIELDINNLSNVLDFNNTIEFQKSWLGAEHEAVDYHSNFFEKSSYKEFNLILDIVSTIERKSNIYWGNSSSVRYGNWSLWKHKLGLTHLTNRGVSGIEGVLASAIGYKTVSPDSDLYCIIGDLSLLYEASCLSTLSYVESIKIIVINNHGGKIFEQIHNSQALGNVNALTTPHNQSFDKLAKLYDLDYFKSYDLNSFSSQWELVKVSKSKLIFEINLAADETDQWKTYFI